MKNGASKKRKLPACRYDLTGLAEAQLRQGLSTHRLAAMVQSRFGPEAPRNREVYYLMAGDRNFPKPEYVHQIAEVLKVPVATLVKTCVS